MSETGTPAVPAPSPEPSIVVGKLNDGTFVAHLHMADKLRTVFGRDIPEVGRRLVSAAISEFGMLQEHAEELVERKGLAEVPTAEEHAKAVSALDDEEDAHAATKAKLDEVTEAHAKARSDLDAEVAAHADTKAKLSDAQAEIDRLKASAVSSANHTPSREPQGSGATLGSGTDAGTGTGVQSSATYTPPESEAIANGGTSDAGNRSDVPAGAETEQRAGLGPAREA